MATANPKTLEKVTDWFLDDLPSTEPPATGSWDCPPNYHQDRYAPFLKHIADVTGTKVTYDALGHKVDVLGKDATVVEQTIERLTYLHSALSLLTPMPTSHQHHMFLPAHGYDKLQITPFRHHSAATTVKTLASPDEWKSLASMGVLVPFRQVIRQEKSKVTTATSRPAVPSRFLSNHTFRMFGNYDMYNKTVSSSEGSSLSSAADKPVSNPDPPEHVLTLRPKEYYSILASENTDRVTQWVDQNKKSDSTTPPVDPQQSVPPEEYPPEQKPVRGVLKRRVRETSKSSPVKSAKAKATQEQASADPQPISSLIPWKPKPVPTFHHTMAQKVSPGTNSPLKQTTLDKYWTSAVGAFEKEKSKRSKPESRESPPSSTSRPTTTTENVAESFIPTQKYANETPKLTTKPILHADSHDVLEIFNALQPTLEAARSFPGSLQLEAHIELITMAPYSPDQCFDDRVVTVEDWKENFQPKKGTSLAPYWAWNKVTGSGADVDAMIDIIWSKKSPQRIFHETPVDRDVVFEYHCRIGDGSGFVISLDEAGCPSFHQTPSVLGCSTIHFPHRMWDMNITLKGEMNLHCYKDPELKKAIDDFVMTIYFEPGNDDIIIFCSEPRNKVFIVDKILMKSTVRHLHIPLNEEASSKLIFKTVEIRQFMTGRKPNHPRLIRGRIPVDKRQECISARLLWYEVSVVSDAIQKLLNTNQELELGQQTEKWSAVELLGDEIRLKDVPFESSQVAQSIDDSGFGSMYRLGKVILDRMRIGEPQLS
ncbi:hypothetical protein TMatcc_010817 [Talaromyces marneffei ATCC 18224]|uniref:Uncharacterized protein n=1 Tax=Talaromyces marneffei (strain ATCC 18224 / CBS 334.59 / QM 7333) TaxID=441960 RepID=B6QUI1_TALMQ|nr:uncharacterized protein EYB26_009424 [Talaromyces marneffei]EEA18637.1 conserved hypothetical protein [Talaromyces marneffei ATCC 18224]KAE8548371.1 hypothetical protein EYB25_008749 [Talaromyces marneffei]QGA21713.1 hypothetical protein EYB26_009424 [Talaromyces marneffei]